MKIRKIHAYEILDSRGFPTVQIVLTLDNGYCLYASAPAGASVGKDEACELRDGDKTRFLGKGVLKAVANVNKVIAPQLVGKSPDFTVMDKLMLELDGSHNKKMLGANAILSVSMVVARAQAYIHGVELYELLGTLSGSTDRFLPYCMFNIFNGGMHANNKVLFQEFMIMPMNKERALHDAVTVYQKLREILDAKDYLCSVGDEGGFAPKLKGSGKVKERQALDLVCQAVELAGLVLEKDIALCLDVAATHFYDEDKKVYCFDGECFSSVNMVDLYKDLVKDYPIISIEDGMSEDDVDGWKQLTQELGGKIQLVGDDIFVTNPHKIEQAKIEGLANAVLIKPNQIGTVTEACQAVAAAHSVSYKTVASHRSGETNDTFIVDFTIGNAVKQLKAGAPARGERVAKYNRLFFEINF